MQHADHGMQTGRGVARPRIVDLVLIQPLAVAPADRALRRAQALRDGYLYVPGLVSLEALAPARALVDGALRSRGWIAPATEPLAGTTDPSLALGRWNDMRWVGFLAEVLPTAAVRAIAAEPALVEVLTDVIGGELELHVGDVCRVVSPGDPTLTTPAHQDAAYVKEPEHVWTAWLPLAACPRALGPLAIWAGSHRAGVHPHAPVVGGDGATGIAIPDDAVWSTGDLALGDVVLFSAFTVHRALDNLTADRLRVSVDYRYRPRRSTG